MRVALGIELLLGNLAIGIQHPKFLIARPIDFVVMLKATKPTFIAHEGIQLAGTGDELQGIKRGIMEMADGIVINKCDGNNVEKCQLAANQFRNALHLFPMPESGWTPKVLTYSGFFGYGVKEVWDMVYQYFDFVKENGYFEYRRQEQAKYWMYESVNEQLRNSFYHQPTIADMLKASEKDVLEGRKTSFVAAKQLLDAYFALLH